MKLGVALPCLLAASLSLGACKKAPKEPPRAGPPPAPAAAQPAQSLAANPAPAAPGHAQAAELAKKAEIRPAKLEEPKDAAPLYDLALKLEDQAARKSGLDVFRGHPTVVTMFYASCPHACPLLVSDLRRLEAALTPAARGKLRVLLVSFDGQKDDPKQLAEMVKRSEIDATRWRMARTDGDGVRELAAALGIAYQKLADGSYNHSSILTLVDADGRVRARQEGLSLDMAPLAAKVMALARQ